MARNLPDIKMGEMVTILDGVFTGCCGEFRGWYYKYKHGWRCRVRIYDFVDLYDRKDIEFLPEQIF